MHHNRARLLKIQLWVQVIEWWFLAGIVLTILGIVATGINYYIHPDLINVFTGGQNNYLYISGLVLKNLTSLLIAVFFYLLFLGIAHLIRYLLELKDALSKTRRNLSPDRS
jgi:hypothetical protein